MGHMMKRLTTQQFINKFQTKFPDKLGLDLSKFEYTTVRSFSTTTCVTHQIEILNSANNLMQGIKRCKQCKSESISLTQSYDIQIFLEKSIAMHNQLYDYSQVIWKNSRDNVTIICNKHGPFDQNPQSHWVGYGCPKCGYKNLRKSAIEFINESVSIHGEQYDYSLTNYVNNYTDVTLICKKHGEFMIEPKNHLLHQRGCPKCYPGNRSWVETKWLDEHNIPEENRQAPVILSGRRFLVDAKVGNIIYEFWGDFWHGNPNKFASDATNTKCGKTFGELYSKTLEKRMLILNAGYILKEIWEEDYMKQIKTVIQEN